MINQLDEIVLDRCTTVATTTVDLTDDNASRFGRRASRGEREGGVGRHVVGRIVSVLIGNLSRKNCYRALIVRGEVAIWIDREGGWSTSNVCVRDLPRTTRIACYLEPVTGDIDWFAERDRDVGIGGDISCTRSWGRCRDGWCGVTTSSRGYRKIIDCETVIRSRCIKTGPTNPERCAVRDA